MRKLWAIGAPANRLWPCRAISVPALSVCLTNMARVPVVLFVQAMRAVTITQQALLIVMVPGVVCVPAEYDPSE